MTETHVETFINEMANQYTVQFNVYRDERIDDIPLDFYAEFQRRDEKYLMSKSVKVWSVETQQYAFIKRVDNLTKETIQQFAQAIDRNIPNFVPGKQEHMSTYFIGVLVTTNSVNEELQNYVKKARKIQFLKYGWHGWADRYIAIVSLNDKKAYVNKKGKEFVTAFEDALKKGE
ncbi:hypothetical protein JCM9140_1431 [Halalkalibacter wakoensis JCM 9140]|uniref:DUF8052 domain-containing protein n=1 Tax=Halalkalibacter wakoensis JCM 9140 TaxID=1236970 RepID=W4Q059_9BACI|nr:hypothetical protein [Halalkalibacter wakoensis]GAE25436.1 hypothetical protein JCM9140_1431 [Halalkalibacter wakoensis JCM 9140]